MSGSNSSQRSANTVVAARIATASCSGGFGLSAGVEHPVYGMLAIAGLVIAAVVFMVLAVCLSDRRSERLFRWARLILGREEPEKPRRQIAAASQTDAALSQRSCHTFSGQLDQVSVAE